MKKSYYKGNNKDIVLNFIGLILTLPLLGLFMPYFMQQFCKIIARNTVIEGQEFEFNSPLKETYIVLWLGMVFCILTLGIYFFWFQRNVIQWIARSTTNKNTNEQVTINLPLVKVVEYVFATILISLVITIFADFLASFATNVGLEIFLNQTIQMYLSTIITCFISVLVFIYLVSQTKIGAATFHVIGKPKSLYLSYLIYSILNLLTLYIYGCFKTNKILDKFVSSIEYQNTSTEQIDSTQDACQF